MINNGQRGFTLVELALVLVVVAVLAAVAIPAYQNIQTTTQERVVRAALASVRAAIAVYMEREIVSGNASGDQTSATAVTRGWPTLQRVQPQDQYSGAGSTPKVMEDGNVPENLYRTDIAQSRRDWVFSNGASTSSCNTTPGAPRGTPDLTQLGGWRYNPCTGEFWANSTGPENSW